MMAARRQYAENGSDPGLAGGEYALAIQLDNLKSRFEQGVDLPQYQFWIHRCKGMERTNDLDRQYRNACTSHIVDVRCFRCGSLPLGHSKSPHLIEQADEGRLMGEQKMVAAFQSDETRARNALRHLATASVGHHLVAVSMKHKRRRRHLMQQS